MCDVSNLFHLVGWGILFIAFFIVSTLETAFARTYVHAYYSKFFYIFTFSGPLGILDTRHFI